MFSSTKTSTSLPAGRNNTPLRSPIELLFLSLQLYRSNLWLFVGYTAWLLLPFAGYFILSFFPEENAIVVLFYFLWSIVEFIITFWTGIILILLVNAIIEKLPFDAEGVRKYSTGLLKPTARVFVLHILLVFVGFFLLIIPGLIAIVWLAFAQTSAILDNKRGINALIFSRSLSEGRFFRVFYRLIGGPIMIGFVYSLIIALIVSIAGSSVGLNPVELSRASELPAWINLLQSIVTIFAIPLLATYMTILYKHLKETREKQPVPVENTETNEPAEGGHKTTPLQPQS